MQMDLRYAGKKEHNCYIVGRDPWGFRGQRVYAPRCAFASVLEPSHNLLWGHNNNDYYTVGYAPDIAFLINGKFLQTMSEILQAALCTVQQWCERTNLSINPNKMVIIPFNRKRTSKRLKEPILFSRTIQLYCEVKYLGLTSDKGLTWKSN
jgi:hypothetical protein